MALAWFIGKSVLLKKWILVICVYLLNIGIGLFFRFLPFDYSLLIAPVVADLCTTPVALSAPPNS
ncbi:hypothetical protein GPK27_12160, partial [Catenibacterium mitsuokai]|uniref:hypothetical protein n=1 Tax=Catenibacterium mitsuokai TaxID=100886 RepID=UPI001C011D73